MNKTVSEYKKEIKLAERDLNLKASLDSLMANKDFKSLVMEEYLHNEVIRYVSLKCDPSYSSADQQASLDRNIAGASAFAEFLRVVDSRAQSAENTIVNAKAEIQLIEEGELYDVE